MTYKPSSAARSLPRRRGLLLVFSLLLALLPVAVPARELRAAPLAFADGAFQQLWERTDAPVTSGKAQRSWYWGPEPGKTLNEPYSGSKTGMRLVQYFDKARMEINNPSGDRSSEWFVTTGLLVAEMISGKHQVGDKQFVSIRPAEIAVGGDGLETDPDAPTYTSFRPVASLTGPGANKAPKLLGQVATATISRAGQVGSNSGLGLYPGAKLAAYSDTLGHNIPQAMWDFLNLKGVVQESGSTQASQTLANWVFVMGYPITEPYWTRVKIDGVYRDALFQFYERRSLAYVPSMPAGWQVQMGNVGQHYYRWLYGGSLPAPLVPLITPPAPSPALTAAPGATASAPVIPPTRTAASTGTPPPERTPSPTEVPGTPEPSATVPVVPTEPADGLVLSVTPGSGSANTEFTFAVTGLTPGEQVQVTFTDPTGATVYPGGSNNGLYTADSVGMLLITLLPSAVFPSAPAGAWLFEVKGLQSGQEGVIGFTLGT